MADVGVSAGMNTLLIRISLGLQLLSLPLLTPQVLGKEIIDWLRVRMTDLAKLAATIASVAFLAGVLLALGIVSILLNANGADISHYNSWPHWLHLVVKIVFVWGGLAVGGAFGVALAFAVLAGLLQVATNKPEGFFVSGGIMFVAAVALQFWATFYPVQ
jgi:hypothetical protein